MVKNLDLEKEWKIRHQEYKNSGLSIKAWCTKNGFKSTMRLPQFVRHIKLAYSHFFIEYLHKSCNFIFSF
jgi:hypothetical protein